MDNSMMLHFWEQVLLDFEAHKKIAGKEFLYVSRQCQ